MPDKAQYNAFKNLDPHGLKDISLKADGRYKFKMHVTFKILWHFTKKRDGFLNCVGAILLWND